MTAWVSKQRVVDLLDRLKRVCHPSDYDTFVAIEDMLATVDSAEKEFQAAVEHVIAVRTLAVDAGLINPDDETTDVIPLIAMFLPIDA